MTLHWLGWREDHDYDVPPDGNPDWAPHEGHTVPYGFYHIIVTDPPAEFTDGALGLAPDGYKVTPFSNTSLRCASATTAGGCSKSG